VSQGVSEGLLVTKVTPPYPPMAKMARVQGAVVLQAVISKKGNIENLRVMSGHPMLVQSALDAVKQWRYRPYLLNGEPVEVETQITVNFSLTG
jgi:protein TonB